MTSSPGSLTMPSGPKGEQVDAIYLETDRLILRKFTADNAMDWFELDQDSEVMRYISDGQSTTLEEITERIFPRILGYYTQFDGLGFWLAQDRVQKQFLGWFHFRPFRDNAAEVELGFRLHRKVWGQGYATEGCKALVRKGFTSLGVKRVVATALKANVASIRVLEKCGLTVRKEYSEMRFPGQDKSAVLLALDAEEYKLFNRRGTAVATAI